MKYQDVPKFMALLAGITNVSAILPNLNLFIMVRIDMKQIYHLDYCQAIVREKCCK